MCRSIDLRIVAALTLAAAGLVSPAAGQEPVERVAAADRALDRLAGAGAALWPSFRVDTIPIVWSFPGRGWALTNWTDDTLPAGFDPTSESGVAWKPVLEAGSPGANMVSLGERGWAFVPAADLTASGMVGLGAHEAFHVWQRGARREGRYREGENAALLIEYPEFDPVNEEGFALEGRLLAAALASDAAAGARQLLWSFVASREARHRAIGPGLAEFEEEAELNEGMAQYVYLEAVELAGGNGDLAPGEVAEEVQSEMDRLGQDLVAEGERSLRRRFYTTGSALGRLLDETAGARWKLDLLDSGLALHDLLALAVGYRAREDSLVRMANGGYGAGLRESVESAIAERRERRVARVEQVLSADGLRLEIVSPTLGLCGFDPQNLLRLEDGRLLHARWIRFCLPDGTAEFNTPVVQDSGAGRAIAVLTEPDAVAIEIGGERASLDALPSGTVEDLSISGPGVEIQAAHARVRNAGDVLELTVEP